MMKRAAALLCFVSLFIFWSYAQRPDDEEDPYYLLVGQSAKAAEDGDYESAAMRLIEAMSMRPDSPENLLLLHNLGMIYTYDNRDSLAIATFDRVLSVAPSMRAVRRSRAKVLLKVNRDDEAYTELGELILADSLDVKSRYLHGLIALSRRQLAVAEADFAVLKDADPTGLDTAVALSELYTLTGREREALPYFKRISERDPDPEAFARLALCQINLGLLSEAGETIAGALEKYPSYGGLYYCRALLNCQLYRLDDAHADAKRAAQSGYPRERLAEIFK